MGLAIFDLDNTLIAGDCVDYWIQYCIEKKIMSESSSIKINSFYLKLYEKGEMDIESYIKFSMRAIRNIGINDLNELVTEYIEVFIKPVIYKKSETIISQHKQRHDRIIVISASPEFLVRPIARLFGIHDVIGIKLESFGDSYKNAIIGTAPYREGKVNCLNTWLEVNREYDLCSSYFYSDSHNDLPLLNMVGFPVATNPDTKLVKLAKAKNWRIIWTGDT